jgi:hypothetical protein
VSDGSPSGWRLAIFTISSTRYPTLVKSDQFVIHSSKDTTGRKFAADDIRVHHHSNRLDVATFKRCEDEFRRRNGLIYLARNKRYYGVNYVLNELPSKWS